MNNTKFQSQIDILDYFLKQTVIENTNSGRKKKQTKYSPPFYTDCPGEISLVLAWPA